MVAAFFDDVEYYGCEKKKKSEGTGNLQPYL